MAAGPEAKKRARAFIDQLRALTVCEQCGKQPIHWVRKKIRPGLRISIMVTNGYPITRLAAEAVQCIPLCISCKAKRHPGKGGGRRKINQPEGGSIGVTQE